jgi:alpha-galactosidase
MFKLFSLQNIPFIQSVIILIVLSSCSFERKNIRIKSENISVELKGDFDQKIQWQPASECSIVAFDSLIQPGLVANGKHCLKFKIDPAKTQSKQITDKEFGAGNEIEVVGIFDDRELKIERQTRILMPAKFKDVVIFQSVYRNLGNSKIHIDTVFTQRILLKNGIVKPDDHATGFASFQGGINEWGKDYELIWLKPGFRQTNFQGIHWTRDQKGAEPVEYIGGGMPFVDIWNKDMGLAVMQLEKTPQWLSLPVNVCQDGTTTVGIVEKPREKYGQKEWLHPGESFSTVLNAVVFHRLDYFDALKTYGDLLRCRGIEIQKTSPGKAYEPYWKSWGLGMDFTQKKIFNALPELRKIGILTANLDDGWFDFYGDWNVNRSPGKFPNGAADMISFVNKLHEEGFKTNLWWYPLGVSPKSKLAAERSDLLVQAEDGSFPSDGRGVYQFCPAYQPALDYIQYLVEKFTTQWGYDGLYSDSRGLASVSPCYNKAHHHKSPLESFQSVPQVYKVVYETLLKYNKDALQEVCICATPHSPYNMPYYQIASSSDPTNLFQVRRRIKVEKAIHGPTFCVGDCYQVPKDEFAGYSVNESFESALGTGAQVTTFFRDLDSMQFKTWKNGFGKYRDMQLSRAEYLNLYDVAFDKPEIHVVRKGDEMYYGIFAESWKKENGITLRGLKKQSNYRVFDYMHNRDLGTISGDAPILNVYFNKNLLIIVTPKID